MSVKHDEDSRVAVRLASSGDVERIAALCLQLGYPASQGDVQRRLEQIQQDEQHAVFVAELAGRGVIGWAHVHVCKLVIVDPLAQLGGLVVDESHRQRGIGRRLMRHVEQWAREKGCSVVYLRSNITRQAAHAFYERIGYRNVKTSLVFNKAP